MTEKQFEKITKVPPGAQVAGHYLKTDPEHEQQYQI